MRLPAVFALSLALGVQAGTTKVEPVPYNRPLPIPLYEEYPVVRDFRLNQAVEGGIRGTFLGLALGSLVAAAALEPDPEQEVFPVIPILAVFGGGIFGGVSGAIGGYRRGRTWEARKARGETVHARKDQVGIEMDAGSSLSFDDDFRDHSHFALAWRLPQHQRWAPDEYQAVAGRQSWHTGEDSVGLGDHSYEDRGGIRILKTFRDALVNPFIGLGGGYARGTAFDYATALSAAPEARDFSTAYAEALAGVEINAFDFFHARIQAAYEPFGPYRLLRRHGDYGYSSNFSLRSSLGASLF